MPEIPKEIHVVVAVQGQYSDRSEWEVCAYFDKTMAEEHARRANEVSEDVCARLRAMDVEEDSYTDEWNRRREAVKVDIRPFDGTGEMCSYDDPFYAVATLPILREVPEAGPASIQQQKGAEQG